eukprot:s627_g7.t1
MKRSSTDAFPEQSSKTVESKAARSHDPSAGSMSVDSEAARHTSISLADGDHVEPESVVPRTDEGFDPGRRVEQPVVTDVTTESSVSTMPDGDAAAGPRPLMDYFGWEVVASPVRRPRLRRLPPISDETWAVINHDD